MNALKELMAVVSSAQIQLEAIDALVVLVIDWQVIGKHALVSYNFIIINFSRVSLTHLRPFN